MLDWEKSKKIKMQYTNIEIKAKSSGQQQDFIRKIIKQNNHKYIGTDIQIDIYFKVEKNEQKTGNFLTNLSSKNGNQIKARFKLRKGNIENYAIYYEREDKKEPKQSKVILFQNQGKMGELERIIKKTHEILVEVRKKREIYFIENIKFHIDNVEGLGKFIEIETSSQDNLISKEKLQEQCNYYKNLFKIEDKNLIENSYSDMLMRVNKNDNLD